MKCDIECDESTPKGRLGVWVTRLEHRNNTRTLTLIFVLVVLTVLRTTVYHLRTSVHIDDLHKYIHTNIETSSLITHHPTTTTIAQTCKIVITAESTNMEKN